MSESVSTQSNGLRTYRPPLEKFVFQSQDTERRISNWKEGVANNKVSRALLLTGDPGLGKTTLAVALCEALGASPEDIREINCASTRTLEDARDLIAQIGYMPTFGKYRVLILDEVHQMVQNAQQAFLTPIEKLPESAILVACTSAPNLLNAAFRSRFFEVRLEAYSEDALVQILENLPNPPKASSIATIVKMSQGNARRAIALAEGGVSAEDPKVQQITNAIDLFFPLLMKRDYGTLMLIVSQVSEGEKQLFFKKVLPLIEGSWMMLMKQTPVLMTNDKTAVLKVLQDLGQEPQILQRLSRQYAELAELQWKPVEAVKGWIMRQASQI